MTYQAIADALTDMGVERGNGRPWNSSAVHALVNRSSRKESVREEPTPEPLTAKAPRPPKRMTGRLTWDDVPADLRAEVVAHIADRLVGGTK